MTRGRGLIIGGAVTIGVGLVVGVVSLVLLLTGVVGAVGDQLRAPTFSAPGVETVHLDPGRHLVFQRSAASPAVQPDDVAVVGAVGRLVVDGGTYGDQTITRGGLPYVARAGFDVPTSGTYVVTVRRAEGTVFVARDVVGAAADKAGWGLGMVGGGLLVLLGIVLLVVGLTQRRRSRQELAPAAVPPGYGAYQQQPGPYLQAPPVYQAPPAYQPPPAGWYPDPAGTGGQRYWDGTAWTDNRA